jgi:hypothetical protein
VRHLKADTAVLERYRAPIRQAGEKDPVATAGLPSRAHRGEVEAARPVKADGAQSKSILMGPNNGRPPKTEEKPHAFGSS